MTLWDYLGLFFHQVQRWSNGGRRSPQWRSVNEIIATKNVHIVPSGHIRPHIQHFFFVQTRPHACDCWRSAVSLESSAHVAHVVVPRRIGACLDSCINDEAEKNNLPVFDECDGQPMSMSTALSPRFGSFLIPPCLCASPPVLMFRCHLQMILHFPISTPGALQQPISLCCERPIRRPKSGALIFHRTYLFLVILDRSATLPKVLLAQ